jgi:ADP-ribose pyrophosphatase YjhB (NUDIX family)
MLSHGRDRQLFAMEPMDGGFRVIRHVAVLLLFVSLPRPAVLLVTSRKKPDKWTPPKGGWEIGETLLAAAMREASEEAGLNRHHALLKEAVVQRRQAHADDVADRVVDDSGKGQPSFLDKAFEKLNDDSEKDAKALAKAIEKIPLPLQEFCLTRGIEPAAILGKDPSVKVTFATRFHAVMLHIANSDESLLLSGDSFPEAHERSRQWVTLDEMAPRGDVNVKKPFDDLIAGAVWTAS